MGIEEPAGFRDPELFDGFDHLDDLNRSSRSQVDALSGKIQQPESKGIEKSIDGCFEATSMPCMMSENILQFIFSATSSPCGTSTIVSPTDFCRAFEESCAPVKYSELWK